MIRQLVNRYNAWLDEGEDAFDGFLRMLSVIGLVLAFGAIATGAIIAVVVVISALTGSDHGSCAVGHRGAKGTFVCDTYYPTPRVEG